MSLPAGARATTVPVVRARLLGAALALAFVGTGCALQDFDALAPPAAPAGQPAGTLVRSAEADVSTTVQGVRDAVTAAGGTVTVVVDHTADASAAGVQIPSSTEVIGGPPVAALPLLRVDQHAGMNLPQRYLVREATDGSMTVATNSAGYVAAVSGVPAPEAQTGLHDSTSAVLEAAADAGASHPAPLVGVTRTDRVVAERHGLAADDPAVDRLAAEAERPAAAGAGVGGSNG